MKKLCFLLVVFVSAVPAYSAPTQKSFNSPSDAAEALLDAASAGDRGALTQLFGEQFLKDASSGDSIADRDHLDRFALLMKEHHDEVERSDGSRVIEAGAEKWPFPAPLVETDGKWRFDSEAGVEEIINRRIGENEIRAIRVAQFFADAQQLYHSKDHTGSGPSYAAKIISSPGKKDGLYWESEGGEASPLGPLVGRALAQGYSVKNGATPGVYQGYRYRILTKQGQSAPGGAKNLINASGKLTEGFALLAAPARWGVGGIMTFMVGTDGVVYEKDLGKETGQAAAKINLFDPDQSWRKVTEER